jgi:hypothetical protein
VTVAIPTFFIVGAPKSGTTYLWNVLRSHPSVFMPRKEVHFFGKDLEFRNRRPVSEAEYLSLFEEGEGSLCGEASVWYLYSRVAASEIVGFQPEAKGIIMLRNPIELLPSLHGQFLTVGNEDVRDFHAALALEDERGRGHRIPPRCSFPKGLLYRQVGRLAEQLDRYITALGRDRIHVIVFDDLKASPRTVVDATLRFLDVGPFPVLNRPVNPARRVRNLRLQRFAHRPPLPLRRLAQRALPARVRTAIGRAAVETVNRANTKISPRDPLDPRIRKELSEYFASDVARLEDMLQRDLSGWLEDGDDSVPHSPSIAES